MIIFALPFSAARLVSDEGSPIWLSKIQMDWMQGFSSERRATNEICIFNQALIARRRPCYDRRNPFGISATAGVRGSHGMVFGGWLPSVH